MFYLSETKCQQMEQTVYAFNDFVPSLVTTWSQASITANHFKSSRNKLWMCWTKSQTPFTTAISIINTTYWALTGSYALPTLLCWLRSLMTFPNHLNLLDIVWTIPGQQELQLEEPSHLSLRVHQNWPDCFFSRWVKSMEKPNQCQRVQYLC
jgi:hypothetical protein